MTFKGGQTTQDLTTGPTLVQLLPRVYSLVHVQVRAGPEGLPTLGALVGFLSGVGPQVCLQR